MTTLTSPVTPGRFTGRGACGLAEEAFLPPCPVQAGLGARFAFPVSGLHLHALPRPLAGRAGSALCAPPTRPDGRPTTRRNALLPRLGRHAAVVLREQTGSAGTPLKNWLRCAGDNRSPAGPAPRRHARARARPRRAFRCHAGSGRAAMVAARRGTRLGLPSV